MRVLEFFSGIGGWRCALDKHLNQPHTPAHSPNSFDIAASFDINTVSNQVYHHNFNAKPSPKCINSLTRKALDKHAAEMWVMSPPCQPYTRNNTSAKRDTNDQRSNAFLHLMQLLREVHCRPQYILLENVVGFESSECCTKFLRTLSDLKYSCVEFILTPTQFGTPNSRPRYYLLASLQPAEKEEKDVAAGGQQVRDSPLWQRVSRGAASGQEGEERKEGTEGQEQGRPRASILHHLPASSRSSSSSSASSCTEGKEEEGERESSGILSPFDSPPRSISDFLDPPSFDDAALLIPLPVLAQPSSWCFDIVTPAGTHTACFTKAYSRYARGTGSVLSTAGWATPPVGTTSIATAAATVTAATATAAAPSSGATDDKRAAGGGEGRGPIKRPRVEKDDAAGDTAKSVGVEKEKEEKKNCLSEEQISTLRLRYFSPGELLRLFGFPSQHPSQHSPPPPRFSFSFPACVSCRKAYELIGNSLNVDVAAHLINFLMENTRIPAADAVVS